MPSTSAKRNPGDKLGNWILDQLIGSGGNGFVWRVTPRSGGGEPAALKVLKRTSDLIFSRFIAEIEALKLAKGIDGVIPLIDEDLPFSPTSKPRWYVMPLAGKFDAFIAGKDVVEVVDAFVPLARTLAELHALGVHHRDIKPASRANPCRYRCGSLCRGQGSRPRSLASDCRYRPDRRSK